MFLRLANPIIMATPTAYNTAVGDATAWKNEEPGSRQDAKTQRGLTGFRGHGFPLGDLACNLDPANEPSIIPGATVMANQRGLGLGPRIVILGYSAWLALVGLAVPADRPQHDYYRTDYGALLQGRSGDVAVWWCDATHKVPPERALPQDGSEAVRLAAAKNDFEAVQVVVRPSRPLKSLRATPSSLTGPAGEIPADHVRILRVAYHTVHTPTDATGLKGRWPDALPPWSQPVSVPAGENQPLWVLVHVPASAAAGDYRGQIALAADGWSATVPIRLHVWDFALPARNHLETAFGFSPRDVFRYHGLTREEDQRKVQIGRAHV